MAIHVAITRKVLPGKEEKFKDALRRFLGDSFLHSSVNGAGYDDRSAGQPTVLNQLLARSVF